jgi:hypothetical protein
MDGLNKTISFVLGLVVVLVFFAVVSGRLNLKNKLFPTLTKSASPSPTGSASVSPTPDSSTTNITKPTSTGSNQVSKPKSIPSTGSPTLLLPILLSGLGGGILLRKKDN